MKLLALEMAAERGTRQDAGGASPAPGLVLRDGRPEEAEALLALWRQAGASVSLTDTLAEVRRVIAAGPAVVLVAVRQGQLVGSVIGSFDGWRGNVYRLAVHPDHRREGIARALVAERERRLVSQGPGGSLPWSRRITPVRRPSGARRGMRPSRGRGGSSTTWGMSDGAASARQARQHDKDEDQAGHQQQGKEQAQGLAAVIGR